MDSHRLEAYPYTMRELAPDEGGGYLVSYPDLDGCFGDGETIEEAIADGRQALAAVIAALESKSLPVPAPGSHALRHK